MVYYEKAIEELGDNGGFILQCFFHRERGYMADGDDAILHLWDKCRCFEQHSLEWYIYRGIIEMVEQGVFEKWLIENRYVGG